MMMPASRSGFLRILLIADEEEGQGEDRWIEAVDEDALDAGAREYPEGSLPELGGGGEARHRRSEVIGEDALDVGAGPFDRGAVGGGGKLAGESSEPIAERREVARDATGLSDEGRPVELADGREGGEPGLEAPELAQQVGEGDSGEEELGWKTVHGVALFSSAKEYGHRSRASFHRGQKR
jgi:hypothetical protein